MLSQVVTCIENWSFASSPLCGGTAGKFRCCMNTSPLSRCGDKSQAPGQHTQSLGLGLSFAPEQREGKRGTKSYEHFLLPTNKGWRGRENHHPLIQNRSWLSHQHKQTTLTPPLTVLARRQRWTAIRFWLSDTLGTTCEASQSLRAGKGSWDLLSRH